MQAEARTASSSLYSGRASSGISSAASGAMNAVGAAWILVSAEAASDGSLALEDAAPLPEPPKLDISVSVSVMSQGEGSATHRLCLGKGGNLHSRMLSRAFVGFISAMSVHLRIYKSCSVPVRAGASITLYRDETIKQDYEARQASGLTSPRAVPAWLQALRAENSSPQVSKRAMNLTQVSSLTLQFAGW